jgi:sugar/nucleoside kinase (ribokinase family)
MRYLVIGHICQDIVDVGRVLGGTATYASIAAHALGCQVTAITRIAPQVDLSPVRDVDVLRLPGDVTTTFENSYTPTGRSQMLHAVAQPIRIADIPPLPFRPDVVHLAPIASEVDPALADVFDGALIGVTPQGWLRQRDAAGRVWPREWPEAQPILSRADAAVLSIDDVGGDWNLIERWAAAARILVVTQGEEGCTVYAHEHPTRVPAPSVIEVDPTGAGDVFAAAFFVRLRNGDDPIEAARFANSIAAQSVTRRGRESILSLT